MSRSILLLFLALFMSVGCTPAPASKDLISSLLSIDADEDLPTIEYNKSFGEMRTVLTAIKSQFREMLEDLLSELFNYVTSLLKQFKVKLLRKLGVVTLADVAEGAIDFATDIVVDPVSEDNYYVPVRNTPQPETSYGYGSRPFSLASLLGGDRK